MGVGFYVVQYSAKFFDGYTISYKCCLERYEAT